MSVPTDPTSITALCDQLDQLRAAATDAPWTELPVDAQERWLEEEDEALIVAAVNALPRLTAALRAVEALADDWEEDAKSYEYSAAHWRGLNEAVNEARCKGAARASRESAAGIRTALAAVSQAGQS